MSITQVFVSVKKLLGYMSKVTVYNKSVKLK